jgi:hypothetical protein
MGIAGGHWQSGRLASQINRAARCPTRAEAGHGPGRSELRVRGVGETRSRSMPAAPAPASSKRSWERLCQDRDGACVTNALSEYDGAELYER